MSLDITLMHPVWSRNITHNLTKMADAVRLSNDMSLYDVLWRPDEQGYTRCSSVSALLREGYAELLNNPEKYKELNPENGWGSYEYLVEYVREYIVACELFKDAEIRVSR